MTTKQITGFEARYNEWCDVALPATVADVLEEDNNGYTMRAIETITKYAVELETLKNEEVESYNEWWISGNHGACESPNYFGNEDLSEPDVLGSLFMAIGNMTPRYQNENEGE